MRIEPLGDSALIVRVVDEFERDPEAALDAVLAATRYLEAAAIPGMTELAPAYTTIGVFFNPTRVESATPDDSPFDILAARIQSILNAAAFENESERVPQGIEVPVCYESEFALDLADVAAHTGLSEDEVIRRHRSGGYRVSCVGFTPGFPYLSGLPAELITPRRATPRTEISAGAVAIGGAQTGIYPRKSPGGWNVIGRTPLRLFDVQREPPALFQAGDQVRFRQISREEFEHFQ
jgi:KipI family sensor histidine kinase inhibitor